MYTVGDAPTAFMGRVSSAPVLAIRIYFNNPASSASGNEEDGTIFSLLFSFEQWRIL